MVIREDTIIYFGCHYQSVHSSIVCRYVTKYISYAFSLKIIKIEDYIIFNKEIGEPFRLSTLKNRDTGIKEKKKKNS